ncbi:MAG: 50S ribosomal protein L22 [Bacilli bacterium]|nr:50S ribosomal protein L22 [Bacilli bacterium]
MARTKKVEETAVVEEVKAEETKAKKSTKKAAPKKESAQKETKKASKKEEPKVLRTEAKASALSVKVTPRKARLVIDLVRGKNVDEALAILALAHHKAAPAVAKLIKSAASNATNNFNMNKEKLYVAEIMASDSIKMKRYLPRAKGSASGLVKRFSNLYVTVRERA